jgi:hypothetical protein
MTAEQFRPSIPHRDKDEELDGYFGSRVSVTEGTATPSGTKRTSACPEFGSVHRSTVKTYEHPSHDGVPYSTIHRNAEEPQSLGALKAHQTKMLSNKQKRKNREKK